MVQRIKEFNKDVYPTPQQSTKVVNKLTYKVKKYSIVRNDCLRDKINSKK